MTQAAVKVSVCARRMHLSRAVMDSMAMMYRVKREYDDATRGPYGRPPEQISTLLDEMLTARERAQHSQREFDEHVHEHRCM